MQSPNMRFNNADMIPHFAKNGTALTSEERASIAKRKGLCVMCGIKTHTISVFKRAPVSNESVYKGTCIRCNPTSVPANILQDHEHRNPRIAAPTPVSARMPKRRIDYSRTRPIKEKNRLESYTSRDDRDIIPIVEIFGENLTKGDPSNLTSAAPTIEDAQVLMYQTMEKEIWEEERPSGLLLGKPGGTKIATTSSNNNQDGVGEVKDGELVKESKKLEECIEAIIHNKQDSIVSQLDILSLRDDQSLGTETSRGDSTASAFEEVSAQSGTVDSWSLCSDSEKQSTASTASDANTQWDAFAFAEEDPTLWSISYRQLMAVHMEAKDIFGDRFDQITMHDINRDFLQPLCQKSGKSYALHQNPNGLLVDAFVSHCWDEPFGSFVDSVRKVFQTHARKPNLWICAFALNQCNCDWVKAQVGTGVENSPFVTALRASQSFVVVRNSVTDLFSRIWCICELMYARKFGFVPNNTYVTGPNCFSDLQTSCINAHATRTQDKASILKILLTEYDYEEIDTFVNEFRAQDTPE